MAPFSWDCVGGCGGFFFFFHTISAYLSPGAPKLFSFPPNATPASNLTTKKETCLSLSTENFDILYICIPTEGREAWEKTFVSPKFIIFIFGERTLSVGIGMGAEGKCTPSDAVVQNQAFFNIGRRREREKKTAVACSHALLNLQFSSFFLTKTRRKLPTVGVVPFCCTLPLNRIARPH